MFTIDQIKDAHSKVKSGADFPAYVQALIQLGVSGYETYVSDGHSIYFGKDGFTLISPAKYSPLEISGTGNHESFKSDLKDHQQGKTDYPTFCRLSAEAGVHRWVVDLSKMTCTYFDKSGNVLLTEIIPG